MASFIAWAFSLFSDTFKTFAIAALKDIWEWLSTPSIHMHGIVLVIGIALMIHLIRRAFRNKNVAVSEMSVERYRVPSDTRIREYFDYGGAEFELLPDESIQPTPICPVCKHDMDEVPDFNEVLWKCPDGHAEVLTSILRQDDGRRFLPHVRLIRQVHQAWVAGLRRAEATPPHSYKLPDTEQRRAYKKYRINPDGTETMLTDSAPDLKAPEDSPEYFDYAGAKWEVVNGDLELQPLCSECLQEMEYIQSHNDFLYLCPDKHTHVDRKSIKTSDDGKRIVRPHSTLQSEAYTAWKAVQRKKKAGE